MKFVLSLVVAAIGFGAVAKAELPPFHARNREITTILASPQLEARLRDPKFGNKLSGMVDSITLLGNMSSRVWEITSGSCAIRAYLNRKDSGMVVGPTVWEVTFPVETVCN